MKKLIQLVLISIVCFQFNCDLTSSKDDDSTTDTPTDPDLVYQAELKKFWFSIDGNNYPDYDSQRTRGKNRESYDWGVRIPYNHPFTNLVAHFVVSEGARVYVNDIEQTSGMTPNDFTDLVDYKIVSQDGQKEEVVTMKVTWLPNTESKLYSMSVLVGASEYVCDVSEANKTVSVDIADKTKSELTSVKFKYVISDNGSFLIGGIYGVVITNEVTLVDISSTYGVTPIAIKAENTAYKTDYTFTRTCIDCEK